MTSENPCRRVAMVTVIIPTYNRTRFLMAAIDSVISQTYPVKNILIIDDGSQEKYQKALTQITQKSDTIKLYRIPTHKGVSHARNFGLDHATGDYILFLDDDDTIHPDFIHTSLSILENRPGIDGIFCRSVSWDQHRDTGDSSSLLMLFNHSRLKEHAFNTRTSGQLNSEEFRREPFYAMLRSNVAVHSCLLRRDAIKTTRFPEHLSFGEDKYFWLLLIRQGCTFETIRERHAFTRLHAWNYCYGINKPVKERASRQIHYYSTLLTDGLLTSRKSRCLVYMKLIHLRFSLHQTQHWDQVFNVILSADVILKEIVAFFHRRLKLKWEFIKFMTGWQNPGRKT